MEDPSIISGPHQGESEKDSGAIEVQVGGPTHHNNSPWTHHFPNQLSTEEVLGMIRDGKYSPMFENYARAHIKMGPTAFHLCPSASGPKLRQLFQKELTPSDVSKLNRLVIPKRYAKKYFPRIQDAMGNDVRGGEVEDMELTFFDRSMRPWKLRYCYWKSSQSYVFTRGWNSFAKEKGLKAKDRVIFSSYEKGEERLRIIDVGYCEEGGVSRGLREVVNLEEDGLEKNVDEIGETKRNGNPSREVDSETKGFRLFGFQIV